MLRNITGATCWAVVIGAILLVACIIMYMEATNAIQIQR